MLVIKKIINFTLNIFAKVGETTFVMLEGIGSKVAFAGYAIGQFFVPPTYFKNMFKQFIETAFYSIPIVGFTALFTGMVLALQSYVGFARFSAESAIPSVLVISITRELGPVLTALMVSGRISSAIAAEIATMKVTEQLYALFSMSVNPIKYLVSPKIIAGILALPLLTFMADIIGIMGGFLISVIQLDYNTTLYLKNTWDIVTFWDVMSGIIKSAVFGLIITAVGCIYGYYSDRGSKGVGSATTQAVVISSIAILLFDYLLTVIFFYA